MANLTIAISLDKKRDFVISNALSIIAFNRTTLDKPRDVIANNTLAIVAFNRTTFDKPRDFAINLSAINTTLDNSHDVVANNTLAIVAFNRTTLDKPRDFALLVPTITTTFDRQKQFSFRAILHTLQQEALKMLPTGSITNWALNTKKVVTTTTAEPNLITTFTVATAGTLRVKTTGTANTVIALHDSTGELIASVDDAASLNGELVFEVTAGVYHTVTRNTTTTAATFGFSLSIDVVGIATVIVDLDAPSPETLAQMAADKLMMTDLKAAVKAGNALTNDEVVFLALGDSVLTAAVMTVLDNGFGFPELSALGLSEAKILSVMATYNVKAEVSRYEVELGIDAMTANKSLIAGFIDYAATHSIVLPSFTPLFNALRADRATFEAIRQWNNTRVV